MKFLKYFESRYSDILDSYGDDYTELKNSTIYPDKETGQFTHVPSPEYVDKLLTKYYKKKKS